MSVSTNNSLKKIVFIVLIAIVAFIIFMAYSINTSISNNKKLEDIKLVHFPVLERVDANIVFLDKIKESFIQAILTGDDELVFSAESVKDKAISKFDEIKEYHKPYKDRVDALIDEFNAYYKLGSETAILLLENIDKRELVQEKTEIMNEKLLHLQKSITSFREYSYNSFSDTLTESNESATLNMYLGVALGMMNLVFMGVLVFFIRNSFSMMAIIAEQNATLEQRVAERTAQLSQKTHDMNAMLDNMLLGVFTVIGNNKIHPEYSRYLETILDTNDIAGSTISECLLNKCTIGSNAADQIVNALESMIGEDEMMYDFNSHLLVNEAQLVTEAGEKRILQIDWNPIISDDGVIEKILVIVQDVTELRLLELEAEESKKELTIISQILKISIGKFNEFVQSSHKFFDENEELIKNTTSKSPELLASLFRNMHTVKGNARTYEFVNLTDTIHEVEQVYDELRKDEQAILDKDTLLEDLKKARSAVAMYQEINDNVLCRKGRSSDLLTVRGGFVSNEEIDQLKSMAAELYQKYVEDGAMQELHKNIIRIGEIPLPRLIDGAVDSIASLAKELGKPIPEIKIVDHNITFVNKVCEPLKSSFMHIVRNSLDHGIESVEERAAKNKPEMGTLTFEVAENENSIDLKIRDDGRGLALHKLYQKALDAGIFKGEDTIPSHQEIAEVIFNSGLTTAESLTQVSGRGVGMDAVRSFLEKQGASIKIVLFESKEELDFTQFEFVISIPSELYTL